LAELLEPARDDRPGGEESARERDAERLDRNAEDVDLGLHLPTQGTARPRVYKSAVPEPADRIERLAADALRAVGELAVTLTELAQVLRAEGPPPGAEAPPPGAPPAAATPGPIPASARLL